MRLYPWETKSKGLPTHLEHVLDYRGHFSRGMVQHSLQCRVRAFVFSRYELLGVNSGSFCWTQTDDVSFDHYSEMLAKRYGLSLITANSNNYFVSWSLNSDPSIPPLLRPEAL